MALRVHAVAGVVRTPRFLRVASSNLVTWPGLGATTLRLHSEVCRMTEAGFSVPNDPLDVGGWAAARFSRNYCR